MSFHSPSPEFTQRVAGALAVAATPGLVVALEGPLGAGKTAFVKGMAAGLGIDPQRVASPTFVLVSEYPVPDGRRLVHADLYRLESVGELDATGFPDLLGPDALIAVEWADRLPGALPADRLTLRIERAGDTARVLHAEGCGAGAEETLARWNAALDALADGPESTRPPWP